MYGEPFDISAPDELVFVSWFQGGEVFRSGCGRIFYFRPGDESYPTYHEPLIQRVIRQRRALGGTGTDRLAEAGSLAAAGALGEVAEHVGWVREPGPKAPMGSL